MEPYSDDEIADARTHLSCDDESDRCHYHDVAHWLATVDALKARLAAAEANIAALREKNKALNLRAQEAEGIIAKAGLVEGRPQGRHGRSLGRALANYYGAQQARRAEEAEAAAATAKVAAGLMRDRAEKAEARAERAVGMLEECGQAFARQEEPDGLCDRIAALLKEVSHGQQG